MERRWRSPPESERPRSPTRVARPSLWRETKSDACASSSAAFDFVVGRVGIADAQIFLDRAREQHRLLKHDADIAAQREQREVADVDAVDLHRALVGIEDAMQQAERRRFARAGRADERDRLAGPAPRS